MLKQLDPSQDLSINHAIVEQLPLAHEHVDFVYYVNALHHFDDQEMYLAETYQILKPGVKLAVIEMDPHH